MTKEVDLVSYLPPYLAEFKEISVALEAENPEFVIVWNAADRVLYNEFIATADEYGPRSRRREGLSMYPLTQRQSLRWGSWPRRRRSPRRRRRQ